MTRLLTASAAGKNAYGHGSAVNAGLVQGETAPPQVTLTTAEALSPPPAAAATTDELLTPPPHARPARQDDGLRRSEEREDDPFDLPPTG